ncbi:MAG: hypothetical protein IJJ72_06890 [Bacteroidales bacterium]|jgi:hypothetical protein|nr:hypothetical protein [Bacteroidales bacterium]MBR6211674.1 hypothetical protein [Bacteroidales bacterium]
MKRFLILFMMAAFVALALTSCKETLPARFDRFVNGVEKRCANFSEDDWKKANEHFGKLVDEYTQNRSSYTVDEQKQIRSAIGKYVGLAAKSGVKTAIDTVNGLIDQIPSLLEGIGNFLKDLGLGTEEE